MLLLGLASSTGYLFKQNRDLKAESSMTTEQKNQKIIDEINKVFTLPKIGTPVVAVVTDPAEFKKQYTAFDDAQNGDYLLFYKKARLNVLYRQSEKRVIKTAAVTLPVEIELVGSKEATEAMELKLKDFGSQVTITKTVKDGITQSFVFDVDGDQGAEATSIAKQAGLEVGTTLPSTITPITQAEVVISVADKENAATPSQATNSAPETTPTVPAVP